VEQLRLRLSQQTIRQQAISRDQAILSGPSDVRTAAVLRPTALLGVEIRTPYLFSSNASYCTACPVSPAVVKRPRRVRHHRGGALIPPCKEGEDP
jgi:hypothetical protein